MRVCFPGSLAFLFSLGCVYPEVTWEAHLPSETQLFVVDDASGMKKIYKLVGSPGGSAIEVVTIQAIDEPYLGLDVSEPTWEEASSMGPDGGVIVRGLHVDAPTPSTGIEVGDVITRLNGSEVSSIARWRSTLEEHSPLLSPITLTRRRGLSPVDGSTADCVISPTARSNTHQESEWHEIETWGPLKTSIGIVVGILPEAIASRFSEAHPINTHPLIVVESEVGLPGYHSGIRPGDRILSVEEREFTSLDELEADIDAWSREPQRTSLRFEVEGIQGPLVTDLVLQKEPKSSQFILPPILTWDYSAKRSSWNALLYLMSFDREWLQVPERDSSSRSTTSILFRLIEYESDPQGSSLRLFWILSL